MRSRVKEKRPPFVKKEGEKREGKSFFRDLRLGLTFDRSNLEGIDKLNSFNLNALRGKETRFFKQGRSP